MDGRGGCCITRYATGAYDMSKVQRIMLRFRPIAPKPTTGSTNSGSSSSESGEALHKGGRQKRRYVKDGGANNGKRCNRRRKLSPEQNGPVVTLPLLPETPDPKNILAIDPTVVRSPKDTRNSGGNVTMWLNFENENMAPGKVDPPAAPFWYPDQSLAAGSCVTAECVTETWVELEGLGSTDEERVVKLSKDSCPAFISDCYGRVTWTNGAYRSMVGRQGGGGSEQGVRLVVKEKAGMAMKRAVVSCPSFTCKVRVDYACGSKKNSLTVPCDVWRLDSGGFAWRLDVKAALSL
ncbi:hypothetical protein QN277_006624 [Acacia crassicarpa]|uniref:DUF7950 domain-containing protein n=1 Tax=Acacia crassicarpa TaxID=499986 RepID=A0AAE1ISU7_9FABA|nr:hypothetical protein QN277_006624 [Acacia crassicarpa]